MERETHPMPKGQVLGFGIYLILLNVALLYILVKIWPGEMPPPAREAVALLGGRWLEVDVVLETRYLLIAVVAGALGSYIHLATSSADYVGDRQLVWSWAWWYILRPFIGMVLAAVVYFVVRGGLIMPESSAGNLSPYGVAAIAALAGMFSKQATDELQEVFENLFTTEKPSGSSGLHGSPDERDDVLKRGVGDEDLRHPHRLERLDVLGEDRAARHDQDVPCPPLPEQREDLGEDGQVGAREDAQADGIHILLDGCGHDLLRRLVEAGVDDLHPGVPEGPRDHLHAPVVAVEPALRHEDPDLPFPHHRSPESPGPATDWRLPPGSGLRCP